MVIPTPSLVQNEAPDIKRSTLPRTAIIAIALLAAGGAWLALSRHGAHTQTDSSPVATVAVAKVTREDLSQYTMLTAEFMPYQEVSVHAKVAGYVQSISVDIGDHVKAGQVMAVLEIPELNDDLKKATAELMTSQEEVKQAQANYEEVHLVDQRLTGVAKANPKLIAQQDLDNAKAKDDAMESALSSAQKRVEENDANVAKMRTLLDYASITAPFDGIITKRYADTGALVQAGTSSSTQAMPLVDIAQDSTLRLVFPVPESAVPLIHDGLPVEITVNALRRTFAGKISRFAGKVERSTRTMATEVDISNADGSLTPGMYASVKLPLEQRKNTVSVPILALSSGEKGVTVFVLNKDNRLEERQVTVGLETATKAEIRSGVEAGDLVLVGGHTGLRAGETVTGKLMDAKEME